MIETLLISVAVLLRILSNPLGNVFQKKLTATGHHPLLVNFLSYLLLSLFCLPFAAFVNWFSLPKDFWLYSTIAGIVGAVGNGFLVKAMQKGELSVLGPVNSYKSVASVIGGIFLLHGVPNVWGLLGIALIVYGSYYVLHTPEERFSFAILKKKEIQFRIWAMVLTAIEAVFSKKIILASSVTIAFLGWCLFGAFFSCLLLPVYRINPHTEWKEVKTPSVGWYLPLIACIATMQVTTIYVIGHMPVGYALALFQLSAIVSVLLGYHVFNEQGLRKKLIGSVIMIAGSIVIILLKNQ